MSVEEFVAKRDTILLAVVGSTAYGMTTADSDYDRLGVYLAPTREVLGLRGPSTVTETHVQRAPEPDVALHELGKYVGLALKANPTVLELLWAEEYEVRTDVGSELIAMRDGFLSASTVRASYAGYAIQQARRLSERHDNGQDGFKSSLAKRTAKHGRHCYRLLIMGRELLSTGTMKLNVSEHREAIFAAGDMAASNPAEFTRFFESELAKFDEIESVLPESADWERANALVVRARLGQLKSE